MNLEDMISHTHDEPDHDDDRSAGIGILGAALIGVFIAACSLFAVIVLAIVTSVVIR